MITLIRLLLTLLVPLSLGYAIVALLLKHKPRVPALERLALAWGIGLGFLGLEMFTFSLFHIQINLVNILLPTLVVIIGLLLFALINKYPIIDTSSIKTLFTLLFSLYKKENQREKYLELILFILIALTIACVFFDALVKPIVNFDDLWRQGCIARIVFETGSVITPQTLDLAGPHPFLNPLAQAWIYLGIGAWNDALGKIIFPLCFTALLFIFYYALRKENSRLFALFFTYLLTAFPLIVYHSGTAYSDLMQTFYYSAGIIYLFQWLKTKNNPDIYISALFLGIGIFVKQLGTPLWVIAAFVLFIYIMIDYKKQFKPFIQFLLISSLVGLPWLVNKQSFLWNYLFILWHKLMPNAGGSATTAVAAAAIPSPYGPPNLGSILYHLGRRMFFYADWQILWLVFIAVMIIFWQQIWQSKLKYLALIILFDLLMVIYGFTEQNAYTFLVDGTLVQRMLMYQVPVALFLVALCLSQVIDNCARVN